MPCFESIHALNIRTRTALRSALIAMAGLLILPTNPAFGAVNFEVGNGVAFDAIGLSTSIMVPNTDDRILIVGFGSVSENLVDVVPTSLRFGGQDLNHLGGIVQNVFTDWYARTDIYYLLNPNIGFNSFEGEVNVAQPTGFRQETAWGMYALVLSGAAQSVPQLVFTNSQNPAAPSSTVGGTVTTTADDSMLVGFTALNAGRNNLFSTSGVTEVLDTATGTLNFGAGYKQVTSTNEQFTWITNGFAAGVGTVAIAEVAPVAATVVPLPPALVLFMSALIAIAIGRHRAS